MASNDWLHAGYGPWAMCLSALHAKDTSERDNTSEERVYASP
jgi:hypothetical protein